MMRIRPLSIEGLSASENAETADRVETLLSSWLGTPYRTGGRSKGVGVDCAGFVSLVLSEVTGMSLPADKVPADAAFHNSGESLTALRAFLSRYPHREVEPLALQPCDVVVAGPPGKGEGHSLIVGKRNLWHCGTFGVCRAGLKFTAPEGYFFKKAFRGLNRKEWDIYASNRTS